MSKSIEREEFLADVVTTALEGGIGYWSVAHEYRWYDPTLGASRAGGEPADGIPYAYAWVEQNAGDEQYLDNVEVRKGNGDAHDIALIDKALVARAFGLIRKAATGEHEIPYMSQSWANTLLAASNMNDAGEIDAGDADAIVQVGLFGEVVYG
jgi:hypothetical protein